MNSVYDRLNVVYSYSYIKSNSFKEYLSIILFFSFISMWLFLAYKFGDWKRWRLYYPTVMFFCFGDTIYNLVFYNNLLWKFKNPFFSHMVTNIIEGITIFPATVLLFLTFYPKKLLKQGIYIFIWVFVYSIIEWFFCILGTIVYPKGWSIVLSIIHNIYQFILLRLHHKNPILAWIIALVILRIFMVIFHVHLPVQ